MRVVALNSVLLALVCLSSPAFAGPRDAMASPLAACEADAPRPGPWAVNFGAVATPGFTMRLDSSNAADQAATPRRAVPFEYSDGYKTRAKIHKYTAFATLPLFIANYIVGQDLYNNPDESKKGLHVGLVTGTAVLFGVNTFTGVWNLWEGRKDTNHRTKRMTHGILMLVADAGFMATAMLAPGEHDQEHGSGVQTVSGNSASTHRAVAVGSMGIATISYLIMLLGGH